MELHAELPQRSTRGRASAVLGVASAALLSSAFAWAHHWGLLADSIVATWAVVSVTAFVVSTWSLVTTRASLLALAGLLFAAGLEVCGGG